MSEALKEILNDIVQWVYDLEEFVAENWAAVQDEKHDFLVDEEELKLLRIRIQELKI